MKLNLSGYFMSAVRRRKAVKKCAGFAWGASLFLMTTAIVAAEEIRQRQAVGDVEVVLTISHAEGQPEPRIESQQRHHLVIWLFDRATSRPIEDAQVKAEVAEAGYAGSEKMLKPAIVGGKPAYGNFFMMPGRVLYRISIKVMRPGMPRPVEARFEYRHHHKLR